MKNPIKKEKLVSAQKEQIIKELVYLSKIGHSIANDIIIDIEKNDSSSIALICTDSDTSQYGIRITQDIWIYSELDEFTTFPNQSNMFKTELMELSDYSDEEVDSWVSAYSKNLENHKKVYGEDWKQVALEFIFEQTAGEAHETA